MSIWTALRRKFPDPEFAYFEEVRNGTGYARRQVRSADALAFSLWPSRGLELHGIEVKVSRSDWLREKNDPEKAEEIAQFCSRWWLVTEREVVKDVGEVPASWGWLELAADGKTLRQRRAAPAKEAKPLDLPMVAAILRKASEGQSARLNAAVRDEVDARLKDEREAAQRNEADLMNQIRDEADDARRLKALLHQLENLLGERILELYSAPPVTSLPKDLVEKLQAFKQTDIVPMREMLAQANRTLREVSTRARLALRGEFLPPQRRPGRGW